MITDTNQLHRLAYCHSRTLSGIGHVLRGGSQGGLHLKKPDEIPRAVMHLVGRDCHPCDISLPTL